VRVPELARDGVCDAVNDGVRLVGRFAGIRDGTVQFSGSLRNKCELADLKLDRLLNTIDEWATDNGLDDSTPPPHRFPRTILPERPILGLDLTEDFAGAALFLSWWERPELLRLALIPTGGRRTRSPG
jgi:putative flavoprotein involved in K+ transport